MHAFVNCSFSNSYLLSDLSSIMFVVQSHACSFSSVTQGYERVLRKDDKIRYQVRIVTAPLECRAEGDLADTERLCRREN